MDFTPDYSKIIVSASEIRNASDYDDFYLASKEETEEQIDGAEKFCRAVEEHLSGVK